MTKPGLNLGKDGSRYVMPCFLILMIMVSVFYYVNAARDDVDRYPVCFITNCAGGK